MVGLVLVSHSSDLVRGLRDLLVQMEPDAEIGLAGGTDDGQLGTSLELIDAALDSADTGDGAIVLYDLGSAQMTAETALEFLDDARQQRCLLVDAPLVEGALAAVAAAGGGADVQAVAHAARTAGALGEAGGTPADAGGTPADAADGGGDDDDPSHKLEHSVTLKLRNVGGLHARPVGQIVRAVRSFDATVRIGRAGDDADSETADDADASSMLALVGLGAQAGTHVVVRAGGPQARAALATLENLFNDGFGEPFADAADRSVRTV